ncbi:MAG: Porin subfamily, partial [Microvirga sp.]|nr:Porin subfamily [Microvirga sp.]
MLNLCGTLRDFRLLNLAANLIWSPVRDLDIGVEVAYDRIN